MNDNEDIIPYIVIQNLQICFFISLTLLLVLAISQKFAKLATWTFVSSPVTDFLSNRASIMYLSFLC